MAVRKNQPMRVGCAALLALMSMVTAPALAAPDRSICPDASAPSLEVATTEFSISRTTIVDEAVELAGRKLEFASSDDAEREPDETEQADSAADDAADSEQGDATMPAESGVLVHKRQMYRRDI